MSSQPSMGSPIGVAVLGSTLDFGTLGPLDDQAYVFATYGSLSGAFDNVNNMPTGYSLVYGYQGNSLALVVVPEPTTTAVLVCSAAAGLLLKRRRPEA